MYNFFLIEVLISEGLFYMDPKMVEDTPSPDIC